MADVVVVVVEAAAAAVCDGDTEEFVVERCKAISVKTDLKCLPCPVLMAGWMSPIDCILATIFSFNFSKSLTPRGGVVDVKLLMLLVVVVVVAAAAVARVGAEAAEEVLLTLLFKLLSSSTIIGTLNNSPADELLTATGISHALSTSIPSSLWNSLKSSRWRSISEVGVVGATADLFRCAEVDEEGSILLLL